MRDARRRDARRDGHRKAKVVTAVTLRDATRRNDIDIAICSVRERADFLWNIFHGADEEKTQLQNCHFSQDIYFTGIELKRVVPINWNNK